MKYCNQCASPVELKTPLDDNRPRYICTKCQQIHYENPKLIVGTLSLYQNQILLCKRAIEPQIGKWTLPAGFLELNESLEIGALRETKEEACATPEIIRLLSIINIPRISQIHVFFLASLKTPEHAPGQESLETKLVSIDNIPWNELSFSSVKKTLTIYIEQTHSNNTDHEIITL